MPVKLDIKIKGGDKALRTLYNFASRLENYIDIKDALMISGVRVRDALNAASPDIKAEYYQTSDNEVRIAPSVERIMKLHEEREGKKFEGTKRCLYLYYERDIPVENRLPTLGINRAQVEMIVEQEKPIIKEIMIEAIKRSIR